MASEVKTPSSEPPLSPVEAAAELGVTAASVRRWIADGQLDAVKLGDSDLARIRITRSALDDFVKPAHPRDDR